MAQYEFYNKQGRLRRNNMTDLYTVWVGGGEVNSYHLTEDEAMEIAQAWIDKGYEAVLIEKITNKGENNE